MTIRLWSKTRERELVTATWLDGEAKLERYYGIPQQVSRHWLYRCVDSVLTSRATAVFVDCPAEDHSVMRGFAVVQQPESSGPVVYWVHVLPQYRRHGVASTLLASVHGAEPWVASAVTPHTYPLIRGAVVNPFLLWYAGAAYSPPKSDYATRRMRKALVHGGFHPKR